MTINTKVIILSAMYFMLGLVSYLLIGEYSVFLWSDPWVYVYMAFWPAIWVWFAFLWILAIVAVIGVIFFACTWWEDRHLRRIHKAATQIRQTRVKNSKG